MENLKDSDKHLDENNIDPIVITDEEGVKYTFQPLASIPYKGKPYFVLRPMEKIDGIEDEEEVVFYLSGSTDESVSLKPESDKAKVKAVLNKYHKLLLERILKTLESTD